MAQQLPLNELDLQRRIVGLARLLGWRHAHFRPARTLKGFRTAQTGDHGFPDLVLVHGKQRRVIFAELKAGSPVREDQQAWLDDLAAVPGVEAVVWRPADWEDIVQALAGKTRVTTAESQVDSRAAQR